MTTNRFSGCGHTTSNFFKNTPKYRIVFILKYQFYTISELVFDKYQRLKTLTSGVAYRHRVDLYSKNEVKAIL